MSLARGLVAAALAFPLAAAAVAGATPAPGGALERLASEFAAHLGTSATVRAAGGGPPVSVRLAAGITPASLASERAALRRFAARAAALPPDTTEGGAADDRTLLVATIERARIEAELVRPLQRDPGVYLVLLAGAVESALDRSHGSACGRLQRAARRLAETPEVLRAARLNLTAAPAALIELAIERCDAVLRVFRADLPGLTAGCRTARLQADLAEADTTAVRAIEAFRSYLADDLLPAARGRPALGPADLRRVLEATLASEVAPVESLLVEAAATVERHRAELESLATRVTDAGARAALDTLLAGRSDAAGWTDSVAASVARVGRFLRDRDLVTVAAVPPLEARAAPPLPRPAAVVLAQGGPGAPGPGAAWLAVGPTDPRAGGPAVPARWDLDLDVGREGLPGRQLRAVRAGGSPSRVGRLLLRHWSGEDWGLYCEDMLLAEGYGGEDPRYRLAAAARALRRAGRALASLGLHAGALTPGEARAMLEDRCLLPAPEAEREARWAGADPALFGYTLGARRLRELQDEARRRLGPRYRTRAFHDAVLRCGASPHGIVRDRLWRELAEATDDHPAGTRP